MLILKQFRRHQWLILILIGLFAIGTLSYTPNKSAQAAETVIIVSQTVYCDRIDVTYEVIAAFPTDYAIITAHSGTTQLGSVNGTGTPSGTYSATVPISPAQPAGTMLYVAIEINDGNGYFVNRVGTQVACTDDSNPGGNTEPPSSGENPPSNWDGYTDGRLNPDPAEYYTIYCHTGTDTLYVVRTSPETETIKEVPLGNIISLEVRASLNLGDFMNLVRHTEDTVTIYGSNGNLAPAAGSKLFSLSECIEHNGGEPELSVPSPPNNDDEGDEETEEERQQRRRHEAEEALEFCYSSYEFFDDDNDLLANCLNNVLHNYQDILTGQEILTLVVMVFCLNLIVGNGVLAIGFVVFRRNRQKITTHQNLITND